MEITNRKEMRKLFHTGFQIILEPDIRIGRKNADFGQGFYLSADEAFSKRWARVQKGSATYLNCYMLEPEGLRIKRFHRDAAWFGYIFANRTGQADALSDYDVIVGPIANDTIYDTWGIITSGLLSQEQALQLLSDGPVYEQTVIKSEKALSALQFVEAVELTSDVIETYREHARREEEQFQEQFAKRLQLIL